MATYPPTFNYTDYTYPPLHIITLSLRLSWSIITQTQEYITMGIFSTVRDTVVAVCQPVISTAQAADESLSIATEYIHNRAVATKLTDKQSVMVTTAETMSALQAKLDADADLKAQYEALEEHFA